MLKEQNRINDGEGFSLKGNRIEYGNYGDYITFVYGDEFGLLADDDLYTVHGGLCQDLAKSMMLPYFPDNDPDEVYSFFSEGKHDIEFISYYDHPDYMYDYLKERWKNLYKCYTKCKLKPSFDNSFQFSQFITPLLKRFDDIFSEANRDGIAGRVFIIERNTAVLTFWWQENPISPDQVLTIISSLKDKYPRLKGVDFYIALAHEIVPIEEFTGDFQASDEDVEQIGKQKEIHLANYGEKRKALNPYLTDRTRHQGQRLQMANGDEMTQAEYNSYLHQENVKRMVKGVIMEYLILKTKLVIR